MTITPSQTKAPHTAHGDCQTADLIHNRILAVLPAAELARLDACAAGLDERFIDKFLEALEPLRPAKQPAQP